MCNNEKKKYPNILNNNPSLSLLFNENISLVSNFIHIHYKENVFSKNGWTDDDFIDLLNSFKDFNYKIIFTSDLGNFSYHNKFLSKWDYTFIANNQNHTKTMTLYSNEEDEYSYDNIISKIVPVSIDRNIVNNKRKSTIYDNNNNTITARVDSYVSRKMIRPE